MATGEDDNKKNEAKGFAGLSSFVSNVDTIPLSAAKKEPTASVSPNAEHSASQNVQPKPQASQQQSNQTSSRPSSGSSAGKWILGIVLVIAVFWFIGAVNKKPSSPPPVYKPSTQSSAHTPPMQTPAYTVTSPSPQPQALSPSDESKPPVGQNLVLSASQIRYCLAENIRLDSAKSYIGVLKASAAVGSYESAINRYNDSVVALNAMVSDYNSRCGSFRYRRGELERARSDIERYHSQYRAEGVDRFAPSQSSSPAYTPSTQGNLYPQVVTNPDAINQAIALAEQQEKARQRLTRSQPQSGISTPSPTGGEKPTSQPQTPPEKEPVKQKDDKAVKRELTLSNLPPPAPQQPQPQQPDFAAEAQPEDQSTAGVLGALGIDVQQPPTPQEPAPQPTPEQHPAADKIREELVRYQRKQEAAKEARAATAEAERLKRQLEDLKTQSRVVEARERGIGSGSAQKSDQISTTSRLDESKPPAKQGLTFSVSQIRYCLAERIRLDGAESAVDNYNADQFNAMVSDYNSRCGNFRHRGGALESARSDIEPYRNQLYEEGRQRLERSRPQSNISPSPPSYNDTPPAQQSLYNDMISKAPQVTPHIPDNAFVSGANWYCKEGYRKVGDKCEAIVVPDNAFVSGANWYCKEGYRKAGDKCEAIVVPDNAFVSGANWYCKEGFRQVGERCDAIVVPDNAFVSGANWYCKEGFRQVGERCEALVVPDNAFVSGSNWYCKEGFRQVGDKCVSVFE